MKFLNFPVFICGAPRSGTTLLSNLLDGHPSLFVLPHETHILQYWNQYEGRFRGIFFKRDFLFSSDVSFYLNDEYFNKLNDYIVKKYSPGSAFSFSNLDEDIFHETYLQFVKKNGISLEAIYKAFVLSMLKSLKVDKRKKLPKFFIEKRPLDNELFAVRLKDCFPKAKFIHILRDPRTRYASSKKRRIKKRLGIKYCSMHNNVDLASAISEISLASFALAKRNKSIMKNDYYIIKYEDLIKDTQGEMKKIADWLGLDWDNSLLKQTSLSKPIAALSSFEDTGKGNVNKTIGKRMEQFEKITNRHERKIINFHNKEIAKEFGYSLDDSELNELDLLLGISKYELPWDNLKAKAGLIERYRNRLDLKNYAIKRIFDRWKSGIPTQD